MRHPFSAMARILSLRILPVAALVLAAAAAVAQVGGAGSLRGSVTDSSGAAVAGAAVHLSYAVSGFNRATTTDAAGQFSFPNVPFGPYSLEVTAKGFTPLAKSTLINSAVGTSLSLILQVAGGTQTITVEAQGPLVEETSTFHTDVDRDLFEKVPLESAS